MLSLTGGEAPLTGPLEKHFPVSCGVDHHKYENDEMTETLPEYEPPSENEEV